MQWIVRAARAVAAAAVFSVLVADAALAQGVTTGAISGRVTGDQGQPLDAAEVRIVNRSTGYAVGATTRANGLFLVQGLEVGGPYSVTVRAIGYQPYVREDVYVRLSEATRVDAALAAGAVELAAVTVTGTLTADFSPTRQGVGTQISDTFVRRIPTFSRDFIDLLKLSPQVTYGGFGAASGGGAYNRFNTFTIDGANQTERFNLSATGGVPGADAGGKIVSLEAVKEFRVLFTPSDVRQGNFAGMLVNAVTKSGTNQFHGGANFAYRSNNAVLGLDLVGKSLLASEFDVKQYGFYAGGPIIRDRLHFFVAPEWQRRTNPVVDPTAAVPADSLTAIANIMQQTHGFDVGTAGSIDLATPLSNLFGRIDFQISPIHRLVVREIYNRSTQDEFFRDLDTHNASPLVQTQGFRFGSQNFQRATKSNSTVAQLYSNFASGWSNELILGYNTIRAERILPVQAPEVSVGVNVGGTVRAVTFGSEQFSPLNYLDQNILEIVNNLSIPMGRHTVTVGGRFDHTYILNQFPQGLFGVYKFPTIAALQAAAPNGYAVGYANSRNVADIAGSSRIRVYSLYAQDQWSVTDRLTLTAGLRGDIPKLLDTPSQNDSLTVALAAVGLPGVRTDATPKTRVLLSPRVGVNYDISGDQRNQIRGTVGIFTGPPPYIQLINGYQNTGLGLVRLSCTGALTPAFTLDVNNLPTACVGGTPPPAGQAGTIGVNLNDPDFKFPQYLGLSAGFDKQLPFNTVLTIEAMYRKAINGVLVREANLRGPRQVGGQPYTDRDGRVLYADTIIGTTVTNNNQRWLTTFKGVGFAEGLIQVTNQSKDYNYSISAQLNRRFSDRLAATFAYTYLQSKDVQSLTSDRAISNWRNGRQLSTSHDDLQATTSAFERPHRIIAYGTYTLPWKITDVTLYYEGVSGLPFVYVSNDDLNGDGATGNDPIYVPNDATDPAEIQIGTGAVGVGTGFVQNLAAAQAFDRFISSQKCMDKQRGQIMARNSCRSPFQHRLDLSIRQSIPQIRGQQLALQLDIFNVLNMLGQWFNEGWGEIKLPTLSPAFTQQSALDATGRNAGPLNQSIPTFTFDNRLYDATTGAPKPFEGRTASVYQIQLTLRYSF